MCLSLKLYTLISCNKWSELNDLLIQDLSFPQFSTALSSQVALHMDSIVLNVRVLFSYTVLRKNVLSITCLCRSLLPDARVCTRCNQNLLFLPPAPLAREESMLCSRTYSLRKIASVKNKTASSA